MVPLLGQLSVFLFIVFFPVVLYGFSFLVPLLGLPSHFYPILSLLFLYVHGHFVATFFFLRLVNMTVTPPQLLSVFRSIVNNNILSGEKCGLVRLLALRAVGLVQFSISETAHPEIRKKISL